MTNIINNLAIPEDVYENLTIKNHFMFGKVMEDPSNCIPMLERLTGNTLGNNVTINSEKSVKVAVDGKGVRYDVYVQDSDKIMYDAEMQQQDNRLILPKRSRFYQGLMDLGFLESGTIYTELPNSYVIFICTFDPFKAGLSYYEFENVCVNMPDGSLMSLQDGRKILMFNTKGKINNVNDDVLSFLNYVETGVISDEYTRKLDASVSRARKNKEWRSDFMRFMCHDDDIRRVAHAKGHELGLAEGHELGLKDVARNMKSENFPIETIIKVTHLTMEEINNL